MKFPDLSGTSNMSSDKSHISNNRLYTHNPSNSSWTYDIDSLIPRHHWKFNDYSDVNSYANDSGLRPSYLNKNGSASLGNNGKIAHSAKCGADYDYFTGTTTSYSYSEITQTMWIKRITNASLGIYFNFNVDQVQFRIENNVFKLYWDGGWAMTSTTQLPLNEWIHIAVTYDLNTCKYYINGVLNLETNVSKTSMSATSYSVGAYNSGLYSVQSYLEDFRVYDRILNQQEIGVIYDMGQGTYQHSIVRGYPLSIQPGQHIKCQDSTPTILNDSGKKSSDGWTSGGVTVSSDLNRYKAYYSYNGRTSYPIIKTPCPGGFKTLSLWYKSPNTTNSYIIDGAGTSTVGAVDLKFDSFSLIFSFRGTTITTSKPSANVWHHIVLLVDGSDCLLYVDSVYVVTNSVSGVGGCPATLEFGKDSFNGYLQDIRLIEYMISETEIKNLYNNGYGTLL